MAALILPNKRSIWPQQGVALDREKVSETGTIYLSFPGAEFRDLVGNAHLTNPGGQSVAQGGRIATFNGSQQAIKAITLPNGYVNMIVAARIRATATQAGDPGAAFGLYNGTAVQSGIGVGFDPSNNVGLTYLSSNGSGLFQRSPGALGRWYTVYGQYEGKATNGAAVAYVDGRRVTTGYGGIVSGATDPANEISIGAQHRSSGFLRQFKGDIEWAALMYLPGSSWQTLTDEVAARLYESGYPYNLLKPAERRIWVPASTGGGTSQAVAFTLDGISAAASQTLGHTQSASVTLDGVTVAASQVAEHPQTLAATLDGVSFAAAQSVGGANAQSLSITLDGVTFAAAQTLEHSQSLAASLEGVTFAASQAVSNPVKDQAVLITLDGIGFAASQTGPKPADFVELLGGGPGLPKKRKQIEKGSYLERLLSPPLVDRLERIKPEAAEVIEEVAQEAVQQLEPMPVAVQALRKDLKAEGIAYREAYREVLAQLVSEMKRVQEEEEEELTAVLAAIF